MYAQYLIMLTPHARLQNFPQWRRGLLRKFIFLVQVQAAITGFQTFYWSSRTASPQFIQWPVRINRLKQLGSVHKIHNHLEATSPLTFKTGAIIWCRKKWLHINLTVLKSLNKFNLIQTNIFRKTTFQIKSSLMIEVQPYLGNITETFYLSAASDSNKDNSCFARFRWFKTF